MVFFFPFLILGLSLDLLGGVLSLSLEMLQVFSKIKATIVCRWRDKKVVQEAGLCGESRGRNY